MVIPYPTSSFLFQIEAPHKKLCGVFYYVKFAKLLGYKALFLAK